MDQALVGDCLEIGSHIETRHARHPQQGHGAQDHGQNEGAAGPAQKGLGDGMVFRRLEPRRPGADALVSVVAHLVTLLAFGGAAALLAAEKIPSARALVALGAASRADHLLTHFVEAVDEIDAGAARVLVDIGGQPFPLTRQLVEDLRGSRLEEALAGAPPLLVLHAPQDAIVPIADAKRLFAAAGEGASFLSLDGADHLLFSAHGLPRRMVEGGDPYVRQVERTVAALASVPIRVQL